MPRSVGSRLFGLLLALTASFGVPVSALAHGHAHHHQGTEHADDSYHSADNAHSDAAEPGSAAEESEHGPGDHPHAIVSAAAVAKTPVPLVALVARRVVVPLPAVVATVPPEASVTLEPRASLAHAPPPGLRAPPTVLG
jgi:hypothetical protein